MAESVSYWICPCGKANFQHEKVCRECEKRKPKPLKYWIAVTLLFLGIAVIAPTLLTRKDASLDRPPNDIQQNTFLDEKEVYRRQWNTAPNDLSKSQIIRSRDERLASFRAVKEWNASVLGVGEMNGKGSIAVDIGGVHLLAGVYLGAGIDTLISRSNKEVYDILGSLKRGEKVVISGAFPIRSGALVEISYTPQSSSAKPQYLFQFHRIEKR